MKAKRFTTLLVSGVLAASMLVGCGGINKNETVATLDGQEIKLGVANFAARLQQAEADDFYRAYFGDDVWSSDLYNNGTTMEDNTKNSVIEMIENLYILQNHMADYDVTLTDDETAKIAEVAAQFMADNDDKAINALGATEDIVKEYLTLVTVQSKMRAAIVADADTNVSDADANTSAYSYVNVSKTSYKDADGNTQEYTDDEKAELADTVQKFHDAAADTTLDTAADEYGYTVSTGTFSSDNTTLDEEVLNALEGLKSEGELSDVVETDNYYYVLRLDEITDADGKPGEKAVDKQMAKIGHDHSNCSDRISDCDTAWSRDSGINCRNCNSSVLFVCSDCNRLCGSGDGRCCAFCCRNRKPVRQSGCGTCGSWSRTDGDRDRCNRYRSWSKTLYYRISGNRQRNCIYFKKTISQKGGGIRDEETLENILDRVWFYVSDRNHMLFGILGNGNEPDRYSTSISTWDQLGIRR